MHRILTPKDLRSIRLASNLSLVEFARRTGLSALDLDAFEKGSATFDPQRINEVIRHVSPTASELSSELLQRHH